MTEIDKDKLLSDTAALHAFNDDIVTKFRAGGGKVAEFGDNLLLLTTTERDEVVPAIIAIAPVFADYQSKTSRVIPLFELTRT
jgi:hypothetical protein